MTTTPNTNHRSTALHVEAAKTVIFFPSDVLLLKTCAKARTRRPSYVLIQIREMQGVMFGATERGAL